MTKIHLFQKLWIIISGFSILGTLACEGVIFITRQWTFNNIFFNFCDEVFNLIGTEFILLQKCQINVFRKPLHQFISF